MLGADGPFLQTALAAIAEYPRHSSDEILETVVLNAETLVNSRLLTYMPLDDATNRLQCRDHPTEDSVLIREIDSEG